ncbi:hypothetical protein Hanom_Chr12g01102121 [Helianthus anomalus]
MSSTIIPSLTTFFSGNGYHSQHPTINSHTPSCVKTITETIPSLVELHGGGGIFVCSTRGTWL